ncbi:unnamed protein product [Rotaria socialis]|nr:unnamed protein product [Rotaria socialis]CAF3431536.1 unnamed protein product [Rotaria socialis]CAF3677277.1 unnamed protein product [Rotaria socialis]CAF4480181.1 unnamed protein product [Rotaria socialis]CAF4573434.1 unnamed protein product [Rotaria socialis]
MDSHSFCVNDIAAEKNKNREKYNKQRRSNYQHRTHLSKDIKPFEKKKIKQLKTKAKTQFGNNETYLQLKHHLFRIKPTRRDQEIPSVNDSPREIHQYDTFNFNFTLNPLLDDQLIAESNDNSFVFDQNISFSLNHNDESGIKKNYCDFFTLIILMVLIGYRNVLAFLAMKTLEYLS